MLVAAKLVGQLGSVVQVGDRRSTPNGSRIWIPVDIPVTIDPWTVFATGGSGHVPQYVGAEHTPGWAGDPGRRRVRFRDGICTSLMFTTLPARASVVVRVEGGDQGDRTVPGWRTRAKTMRVYPVSEFVYPNPGDVEQTHRRVDPYVPSTTGAVLAGTGTGNGGWTTLDATPLVRNG